LDEMLDVLLDDFTGTKPIQVGLFGASLTAWCRWMGGILGIFNFCASD